MRQTPFGVWNAGAARDMPMGGARSNEADAFRRLEFESVGESILLNLRGSNEADAFRRLESIRRLIASSPNRLGQAAPMRQTPFGVWNLRWRST